MAASARCTIDAVMLRQLVNAWRPQQHPALHQQQLQQQGGDHSSTTRLSLPSISNSYGGASIQQPTSSSLAQWSSRSCRSWGEPPQVITAAMRAAGAVSDSAELSLESESGVSYDVLRERLAAGEWELADEETRHLLCTLAGEGAAKRKWVYFTEVQFIPAADMKTIDGLWRSYSNNKFGYSVQRRIWKSVDKDWTDFFKKVGWTRLLDEKNYSYCKFPIEFMWDVADPTPEGHLPLTNALRGTQLLEKILSHPAFDDTDKESELELSSALKLF